MQLPVETTVGLTATTSDKWSNLRRLVVEQSVRSKYDGKMEPLLEATDPYAAFSSGEWTAQVLARSAREAMGFADAMTQFAQKEVGKYHTPAAEWLHHILRPHFRDLLPDDETYDQEWDRAEVVLGVLAQDIVLTRRATAEDGRYYGRSHWFGRSAWRGAHSRGNAVEDIAQELRVEGSSWGPLRAGLFGGVTPTAREWRSRPTQNRSPGCPGACGDPQQLQQGLAGVMRRPAWRTRRNPCRRRDDARRPDCPIPTLPRSS